MDYTACTYENCKHRDRLERLECREHYRNARLKRIEHLMIWLLDEKVQLLLDRHRNMDLLFPPDEAPDSPATPE